MKNFHRHLAKDLINLSVGLASAGPKKIDFMTETMILGDEAIISKIYLIRGRKVMLDYDLAEMYAVETKQLKRQVRRNLERFPADFMFELTFEEYEALRSQIGTLKRGEHGKYAPMAPYRTRGRDAVQCLKQPDSH